MLLFLVRHARALPRATWPADDLERPLDDAGARQAEDLVPLLRARLPATPPPLIVSSPARRCVQTLEPFARAAGVPVISDDRLVEAGHVDPERRPDEADAPGWLADRAGAAITAASEQAGGKSAVVVCTHGEVLLPLLARLCPDDVDERNQKGGFWLLEIDASDCRRSEYVPAP